MTAPVAAWLGRSYQDFKVRMLTRMVDLIPAAFVGGVQLSNSHCRTLWGRDSSVHSFLVSWVPSCSRPITCDSRCWRVVVQLGKSSQSVGVSCSRPGRRLVGILTESSRELFLLQLRGRVKEEMTAQFGGEWWIRLKTSRRLLWRSS